MIPRTRFASGWRMLGCAALLAFARPAAAQSVLVRVVDAENGAPLAGAAVRVADPAGEVVSVGFTKEDGRIVLRLRGGGTHAVAAELAGYQRGTARVEAERGARVDAEVRMAPRPFGLDTLRVIARGRNERGRGAFERRRAGGRGVFLDSAFLAPRQKRDLSLAGLLFGVPGVVARPRGTGHERAFVPTAARSYDCLIPLVDGAPSSRSARPNELVAVEVYATLGEVPEELRQYAYPPGGGAGCGVIVYWTRIRW